MLEIKPGDRSGRLEILERCATAPDSRCRYLCRCDCGAKLEVRASSLASGLTRSCGCLRRERMQKRNRAFWQLVQQQAEAQAESGHDYAE